jgi:peptidoglycan/LPS O-acetylase OafA/YrhL
MLPARLRLGRKASLVPLAGKMLRVARDRRFLGVVGAALLAVGAFLPAIQLPAGPPISLARNNAMDGFMLAWLAISTALAFLLRVRIARAACGICAPVAVATAFALPQYMMKEGGSYVAPGWIALFAGASLIAVGAAIREPRPQCWPPTAEERRIERALDKPKP